MKQEVKMHKILIVYYSRKGENYCNGVIRNLAKGNTAIVAEMIQEVTGGDIFEIETLQPYPANYQQCTEAAKRELSEGTRPLLKSYPGGIQDYETIFVGYPNWWGTMPMALFSFMENYDLKGKAIIPFCTNEGSGMGHSESDLRRLAKGAEVMPGLAIHGAEAVSAKPQVEAWIQRIKQFKEA